MEVLVMVYQIERNWEDEKDQQSWEGRVENKEILKGDGRKIKAFHGSFIKTSQRRMEE